jgi:beta-glucosidase
MQIPKATLRFIALISSVVSQNASTYKDPSASIDDLIDLLSQMTIQERATQLIQGDIRNWINNATGAFYASGLAWSMTERTGSFTVGMPVPQRRISEEVIRGQRYLVEITTLGIPAFVQTEGIHGFLIGNANMFNSPIGQACSFNPNLSRQMGGVVAQESLALCVNQLFGQLADLARELRYGRVEETYGEDGYFGGEIARAYVEGL